MAGVTKQTVLEQLQRVKGPDLDGNIVELNLVSEVVIANGRVYFSINVPPERAEELEPLRQAAEKVVGQIEGVEKVIVSLTAEKAPGQGRATPSAPPPTGPSSAGPAPSAPAPGGPARAGGGGGSKPGIPGVKKVIAVASGKGGVGKSTTAANLALGLSALGLKVGILDADIYGPSMPRLFAVTEKPRQVDNKTLLPLEAHGLNLMSIGFLVAEETPMIWRGPMVISALTQMMREVRWGDLDVLVVDMPPGTGDAQLTMSQQVPLAGAVIVSTPQDLALIDARKGLNMFRQVQVPVLGIIENMSTFICPSCGHRSDIFGHGGAAAEAERLGVPFLGEVPLHMSIRETSDGGAPVVVSEPEGPHATIYKEIAAKVWANVEATAADESRAAPAIVFE
ncbi:MAG: iron-sulfur cluster carrier protein ApbC [Pseudomonadota bacterium]